VLSCLSNTSSQHDPVRIHQPNHVGQSNPNLKPDILPNRLR
jgi:hypothetical protein